MKEKALENHKAAKLLFDNNFYSPAASRAYYGVYQMAWYLLGRYAIEPPSSNDGRRYWRHNSFPSILAEDGFIGPHQKYVLEILLNWRIKADYYPDEIEESEARESLKNASELIEHFLREASEVE